MGLQGVGMSKLEKLMKKNLESAAKAETQETLGDRSKYIGASDISGCLRKSYLTKVQAVEYSTEQLIIFKRGHLVESIAEAMLHGMSYKSQVEVSASTKSGFKINAHIDFVVYDKNKKYCKIIEVKSTSKVDEPFQGHVLQLQLQMGLLKEKIIKKGWSVMGAILYINPMTGWSKLFDNIDFNSSIYNIAMDKAERLAEGLQNGQEPEPEEQLYCSSCPFKGNCPAITNGVTMLPEEISTFAKRLQSLKETEKEIKTLKTQVKRWFEETGTKKGKVGDITLSLIEVKGKEGVDIKKLKENHPDIWDEVKKLSAPYSWVKIV